MGAWVTCGLGSDNAILPGFVVLCPGLPVADVSNWRAAFLPRGFQGTYIDTRKTKVEELLENITNPAVTRHHPPRQLHLLAGLHRPHPQPRAGDAAPVTRMPAVAL